MASSKIIIVIKASSTNPELYLTELGKNAVKSGTTLPIAEAWTSEKKKAMKFKQFSTAENVLNAMDGELFEGLPLPIIGRREW